MTSLQSSASSARRRLQRALFALSVKSFERDFLGDGVQIKGNNEENPEECGGSFVHLSLYRDISRISISKDFVQIEGRVLQAPKLKSGNDDFFPRNGRWNFNNKRLVEPTKIERLAIVNFSACCDPRNIVRDLIKVGLNMKGVRHLIILRRTHK